MARYKKGINGPVKGRIGSVVAATCRGIDYLRSLGEPSGKPPSPAQLNQRLRFALVMGWLKPLIKFITIGFPGPAGDQTPMNRAVSFHLKEALRGTAPDYEIDFPKAVLSKGELQSSWISTINRTEDAVLELTWIDEGTSAFCNADDQANFIIYNAEKGQFATFAAVAARADQQVALQLPKDFAGDALHLWMSYASVAGNLMSTSVYRSINLLLNFGKSLKIN